MRDIAPLNTAEIIAESHAAVDILTSVKQKSSDLEVKLLEWIGIESSGNQDEKGL